MSARFASLAAHRAGIASTTKGHAQSSPFLRLSFRSYSSSKMLNVEGCLCGTRSSNQTRGGLAAHLNKSGGLFAARGHPPSYLHVQKACFQDFFGGGMGGMGGGGGDTELYDELGIKKDATEKEIKNAYRKLAMKHHPDQGGDTERFTKIQEAYEILKDEEKRRQYDQFGKAAVDGSMGGGDASGFEGMDVNDVFSQFFGGNRRGGRPRGPVRTEDMVYNLTLDLESLYTGTTKKIAVNRNAICSACDGLGAASINDVKTCSTCGGSGVVMTTRQLGPMIQQVQSTCPSCAGTGKIISPGKECSTCNGQKIIRERKTFDVNIKAGTLPNSKLVLRGESNQMPDATPGDVVLVINETSHPTFKRQGSDLIYEHTLSLAEALTGYAVPLKFLDGNTIMLQSQENDPPIGSNTISKVTGKGMKSSGDLYVVWKVATPQEALPTEQREQLRSMLGPELESVESIVSKNKDAEFVDLKLTSVSDRRRRQQRANPSEEGEDDGGSGCRQM